jgi:hypothetical protein
MPLTGLLHANKYDRKDSPAEKEMRVRTREHLRNEGSTVQIRPSPPSSPGLHGFSSTFSEIAPTGGFRAIGRTLES